MSDIRDRYRKQKADLKQLSVKWVLKYELQVDPAVAAQIDGHTDYLITEVHAAFKGPKRLYDQKYRLTSGKRNTIDGLNRNSLAYDGQTTQHYKGYWDPAARGGNWARLTTGDTTDQFYSQDEFMACHGLPKAYFRMLDEPQPVPLDLAEFLRDDAYQAEPDLQPAADGTPCVLVKGGRDRIWFDPKRNLALRQREWQHLKHSWPARRLRYADHVEVVPGTWMAKTVYLDYFCDPKMDSVPAGRAYKTGVLRVTALAVGSVPDSVFRLALEPGTWVEDATQFTRQPDGRLPLVNYDIPANPADLDAVVQNATLARVREDLAAAKRAKLTRWVIAANVVLVCAFATYLQYRRSRRRAADLGATSLAP